MRRRLLALAIGLVTVVPVVSAQDAAGCVRLQSTMQYLSRDPEVSSLQAFLRTQGYPLNVTGRFDQVTQLVLRDWQRVRKLPMTARTDQATRNRIASVSGCLEAPVNVPVPTPPPTAPSNPSSPRSARSLGKRMPIIRVLSPNGGERIDTGSFQTITWSSANVTNVNILLSRGSAAAPGSSRWEMLAEGLPNTGTFTWPVPGDLPTGTEYRIRVADSATLIGDEGNGTFSVVSSVSSIVQVLSPNGGEVLTVGDRVLIRWAVQSPNVKEMELFLLDTSRNGDRRLGAPQLLARVPNNGGYVWKVPFRIGALDLNSTQAPVYKVIARALHPDGSSEDASDSPFAVAPKVSAPPVPDSLTAPSIQVIAPFSGQKIPQGKTISVRWTSTGVSNVFIRLLKGAELYRGSEATVSAVIPNTGSFDWTVPLTLPDGDDYRLRVQDIDGKAVGDIPFVLAPGS